MCVFILEHLTNDKYSSFAVHVQVDPQQQLTMAASARLK